MAGKERFAFTDPSVRPDDELTGSVLGRKFTFWNDIIAFISETYPGSQGRWNFYNDGKLWLYKMEYKKKTVFWGTVLEDTFRITFYFGGKAEPFILSSDLPDSLKDQYTAGQRFGKIRAITVLVNSGTDVENVKKLIPLKVKMK